MPGEVREFFESIPRRIDPEKTKGETVSYRFDIDGAGSWRVDVVDGAVSVAESNEAADCVISAKEDAFLRLLDGTQNPTTAFMLGRIKVDGDMALALKLQKLFF
jgi:putative sterol carrier protein